MTTAYRNRLREIMQTAWGLYRADPTRTFADALAGAWRWVRKLEGWTPPAWATQPGRAVFRSMVSSPIRRSLSGQPDARRRGIRAEYVSASFGR